jgi:transcriptional regulator with XRE-family HTH domain
VLGDVVRRYRVARGLKQDGLAVRAGTTQSVISKIERGVRTNLTREVLERLATALDVPLADLIHAVDQGPPHSDSIPAPPAAPPAAPSLPTLCPPEFADTLARVGPYLTPRAWELLAAYAEGLAAEHLPAPATLVPVPPAVCDLLRLAEPDLAPDLAAALTTEQVYFRLVPHAAPPADGSGAYSG